MYGHKHAYTHPFARSDTRKNKGICKHAQRKLELRTGTHVCVPIRTCMLVCPQTCMFVHASVKASVCTRVYTSHVRMFVSTKMRQESTLGNRMAILMADQLSGRSDDDMRFKHS